MHAIVIDPGCAKSVLEHLHTHKLTLDSILITHHHPDHTGGINELSEKTQAKVIAPTSIKSKHVFQRVIEGDNLDFLGLNFRVIGVPGHTLDHIAFYTELPQGSLGNNVQPIAFCGDTLFSVGCGRLFEGTPEQMWQSLSKLTQLPQNTLLYPAHEYTMSNIQFAKSIMPNNLDLVDYERKCISTREKGLPTLPTRLEIEMRINPFLNQNDKDLISFVKEKSSSLSTSPSEFFAYIRKAKDIF